MVHCISVVVSDVTAQASPPTVTVLPVAAKPAPRMTSVSPPTVARDNAAPPTPRSLTVGAATTETAQVGKKQLPP